MPIRARRQQPTSAGPSASLAHRGGKRASHRRRIRLRACSVSATGMWPRRRAKLLHNDTSSSPLSSRQAGLAPRGAWYSRIQRQRQRLFVTVRPAATSQRCGENPLTGDVWLAAATATSRPAAQRVSTPVPFASTIRRSDVPPLSVTPNRSASFQTHTRSSSEVSRALAIDSRVSGLSVTRKESPPFAFSAWRGSGSASG